MATKINSNLQLAGCRFINKQLSNLTDYLEGVDGEEAIESVHQARVAGRRLRSAFSFFSDYFDAEKIRMWTKGLKRLMKSLGTARDLDVQIEFLKGVLAHLDAEHKKMRPGLERVMLRWQQRRAAAQTKIIKAIAKTQKKHVLTDIHLEAEQILFEAKESPPNVTGAVIASRINQQLQTRIEELMDRKVCLKSPDDHEGHHALRIAAKRLRYEMEISDLVLRGKLKNSTKKVKNIQTVLGDLHDCVVWESDISDFIEQERQRTIEYYGNGRPFARILPGLEFLRQERHSQHEKLLAEACDYIGQLDQKNFWVAFLEQLRGDTTQTESSGDNSEKENKQADSDHCSSV